MPQTLFSESVLVAVEFYLVACVCVCECILSFGIVLMCFVYSMIFTLEFRIFYNKFNGDGNGVYSTMCWFILCSLT